MLKELKGNKVVQGIAITIAVIATVLVAIAGVGFFVGLLLAFLIGVSIYFGSIRILAGSALLAVLLKTMGYVIKPFLAIWLTDPRLDTFFSAVRTTSYIHLILVFFFLFYLLSFGTGSIRLFSFENNTHIEAVKAKDESTEDKPKKPTIQTSSGS